MVGLIMTAKEIAKYCLDRYWNYCWDIGSPAYKWALKWAKTNIRTLKTKPKYRIYVEYEKTLRQD